MRHRLPGRLPSRMPNSLRFAYINWRWEFKRPPTPQQIAYGQQLWAIRESKAPVDDG